MRKEEDIKERNHLLLNSMVAVVGGEENWTGKYSYV